MSWMMAWWFGKPKGALEAMRQERENKIARMKQKCEANVSRVEKEIEEINREIAKKD